MSCNMLYDAPGVRRSSAYGASSSCSMSTSVGSLNKWLLASATDQRSSCNGQLEKESAYVIGCAGTCDIMRMLLLLASTIGGSPHLLHTIWHRHAVPTPVPECAPPFTHTSDQSTIQPHMLKSMSVHGPVHAITRLATQTETTFQENTACHTCCRLPGASIAVHIPNHTHSQVWQHS
jgi:hypothetical protein